MRAFGHRCAPRRLAARCSPDSSSPPTRRRKGRRSGRKGASPPPTMTALPVDGSTRVSARSPALRNALETVSRRTWLVSQTKPPASTTRSGASVVGTTCVTFSVCGSIRTRLFGKPGALSARRGSPGREWPRSLRRRARRRGAGQHAADGADCGLRRSREADGLFASAAAPGASAAGPCRAGCGRANRFPARGRRRVPRRGAGGTARTREGPRRGCRPRRAPPSGAR